MGLLCAFAGACAGRTPAAAPASAPAAPPSAEARADSLLQHFDVSKDGKISKDEFTVGVVNTFRAADHNGSLTIDKHELGAHWNAESDAADTDHDRRVSLGEALKNGDKAFGERDLNHDGVLDRDEIIKSLRKKDAEQQKEQAR